MQNADSPSRNNDTSDSAVMLTVSQPTKDSLSWRRVALLVAGLEPEAADALLARMPESQAALIRNAILNLDAVDDAEQDHVMRQFLGRQQSITSGATAHDEGVELQLSFSGHQTETETPVSYASTSGVDDGHTRAGRVESAAGRSKETPLPTWDVLQHVDAARLGRLLHREHPQTLAVVAAELTPERAAEFVAALPPALQPDVLRRLAQHEQAAPDVLADLRGELGQMLARELHESAPTENGLTALVAILQSLSDDQRAEWLDRLALHDPQLAQRLGHVGSPDPIRNAPETDSRQVWAVELDDLGTLDDKDMLTVLQAAGLELAAMALSGSRKRLADQVLARLPARVVRQMRQRMLHLGPVVLREIDRAQLQLVALANELARDGIIHPPSVPRNLAMVA